MDSRVSAVNRSSYPPPLLPPPTTPPPSFPTTTEVLASVPPPYSSSDADYETTEVLVSVLSPYSPPTHESASKACAACRFRRQKCKGDYLLAPFFPAADESRFQKAHRLLGVSKMKKILESLLPHQRAVAMATMIYESEVHAASPDTGCLDIILQLHSQIE
ncbi:LOB domain-containing protein 22-like [Zingiber officinale]|uniref:LOB domain-containing protein n=1 Tax=Zingiber officinale TaxID=94328 RepID=A0A8J5L4K2_ZINOF|nr:LOB domain-containing protein 22-like [Zingiber officinale]KAG6505707.1 hypothetical protein ZIOFF_038072 [Zingiber officinale]